MFFYIKTLCVLFPNVQPLQYQSCTRNNILKNKLTQNISFKILEKCSIKMIVLKIFLLFYANKILLNTTNKKEIYPIYIGRHVKDTNYAMYLIPEEGVDPAFRLMRFPLDGELDFYLKNYDFYLLRKMTWSRHLFLFYF